MKVIRLDESKLYIPKKEDRGLWNPEPIIKEARLKKRGKHSYISGMKYDCELRLIVPDLAISPDYILHVPCEKHSSSGTPCPVCLEKYLKTHDNYRIHYRGIIMAADTPDEVMLRYYGEGDVELLHWGMAGEVGICYKCSGLRKPHY